MVKGRISLINKGFLKLRKKIIKYDTKWATPQKKSSQKNNIRWPLNARKDTQLYS